VDRWNGVHSQIVDFGATSLQIFRPRGGDASVRDLRGLAKAKQVARFRAAHPVLLQLPYHAMPDLVDYGKFNRFSSQRQDRD